MLWSSASLAVPIYGMTNLSHVTKMRVNITVIAMGTVVPMSKVELRQRDLVLLLSGLRNTTLTYQL